MSENADTTLINWLALSCGLDSTLVPRRYARTLTYLSLPAQ